MGKSLIRGAHHIALKCISVEEFEKTVSFYTDILGMEWIRSWGSDSDRGTMIGAGNCVLEIFASGRSADQTGTINHIAFDVEDVDACIEAVREAGYTVSMEPTNIVIGSVPPLPARIAFCYGPVGEEIEFFCEM